VERIPEFYDEDFPIHFELADGSPVDDLRPRHPRFAVCQCGNREFRLEFPRAVCTVAACTKCGAKGCVHEG
jgi:hypothetical protein